MNKDTPRNLKEAINIASILCKEIENLKGTEQYFFSNDIIKDDETYNIKVYGINPDLKGIVTRVTKKQLKNMLDERTRQLSQEYGKYEKIVKMYCECKNKEEVEAVYVKLEKEHWGIKG